MMGTLRMFELLFHMTLPFSNIIASVTDPNTPLAQESAITTWLFSTSVKYVAAVLAAITLSFFAYINSKGRLGVKLWAMYKWIFHFKIFYYFRKSFRHNNAKIICLGDYCDELVKARKILSEFARKKGVGECSVVVRVFTKQLPSDWPVWVDDDLVGDGGEREREIKKILKSSPLGNYALDFNDFLKGSGDDYEDLKVKIERYTVIDNKKSPDRRYNKKYNQLLSDLKAKWYSIYLKVLHGGEDDTAFLVKYDWVWPTWLSDCVLMGVHIKDQKRQWLWAFSSSYSPGEDVLIYRHYRIKSPGRTPTDYPSGFESLKDLASKEVIGAIPFSELKKIDTDFQWLSQLENCITDSTELNKKLTQFPQAQLKIPKLSETAQRLLPLKITPHIINALGEAFKKNIPGTLEAFQWSFSPNPNEELSAGNNCYDGIGEELSPFNPVPVAVLYDLLKKYNSFVRLTFQGNGPHGKGNRWINDLKYANRIFSKKLR